MGMKKKKKEREVRSWEEKENSREEAWEMKRQRRWRGGR
jgi:hypothetical protein